MKRRTIGKRNTYKKQRSKNKSVKKQKRSTIKRQNKRSKKRTSALFGSNGEGSVTPGLVGKVGSNTSAEH